MRKYLDLITPVRSFRLLSPFVFAALLCLQSGGQTLERLATAYAEKPTPANRAAILRFAAAHTRDQQGALAYFSMARTEMTTGAHGAALGHVKSAAARLPELADYLAFVKGATEYRAKDFGAAGATMAELLRLYANSPLRTDAAIIGAKALMESGDVDGTIRLLRSPGTRERQPEFDFLLGKAYGLRKDFAQSAAYLQRVALRHPQRPEAPDAEILLREAEAALGSAYPPPTAKDLLARAEVLRSSRRYDEARAALQSLIPQLLGEDRERAELHIAVMEYDRQRSSIARQMLDSLSPKAEDVDAERLHYLVQCARRLNLPEAMLRYANTLRTRYPYSAWTMNAHRWAGNLFLLQNDVDAYVPLFQACADSRPQDPESAYCHWKVVWASYLARKSGTEKLLEDHLARYPHSDKYAAGLYFLGRWWERSGNRPAARASFEELLIVEPLSYYAEVAAQSLEARQWANVRPDATAAARLAGYRGKALREDFTEVAATPETARRLKRASLLSRVAMTDWVDLELRSYNADLQQRQLLAMELASVYARGGDHFRALRTMKSMAPGYFRLKVEQAPKRFWELLFPMPYGASLAKHSATRGLDPYLVAGLIRQESEFKPDAVSRAKARGLMQVLPTTGRSLTRRLKLGAYRVNRLDQPDFNINLGTYYLSTISSAFDGRLEYVLASYNAGKSRADSWKTWAQYEEPLEFIETIPFSETREYVLSVLRNAMVYRQVYPNLGNLRVAGSRSQAGSKN
jgi:soluble lytic murein transglycosylase